MTIITVAGTHGYDDTWKRRDSPVSQHLARELGADIDDRFIWSTALGGIGPGSGDLRVWESAGQNLFQFCVPPRCPDRRIAPGDLVLLTHSHGLQVALFALAAGLKARALIDVCGPVREDMLPIARLAAAQVDTWTHLHGGRRDRWQWFGALFDGHVGIRRAHPLADRNVACPDADHDDPLVVEALWPLIAGAVGDRLSAAGQD